MKFRVKKKKCMIWKTGKGKEKLITGKIKERIDTKTSISE